MIETRVRVDQYTNVHAVAETADGKLFVSTVFVKAAGGCSAPTGNNADAAGADRPDAARLRPIRKAARRRAVKSS